MTRSSSSSRQFTIPSEVRGGMFGIKPLDEVEIIEVRPRQAREAMAHVEAEVRRAG